MAKKILNEKKWATAVQSPHQAKMIGVKQDDNNIKKDFFLSTKGVLQILSTFDIL